MIIKSLNILSNEVINEILALVKVCKEDDNCNGSIFLDKSLNFNHDIKTTFLLYENGELVSVLSIFCPRQQEAEITAYTLPYHRRKGYFTALLAKAIEELKTYQVPDLIFVFDAQSTSGKEVALKLNAQYDFTEYFMRFNKETYVAAVTLQRVKLQRPQLNDLNQLIDVSVHIFDNSYEDAENMVKNSFQSATREQFVALLGKEIIGMGSVGFEDSACSINGFGIVSESRGMGYGREFLQLIIDSLWQRGKQDITIDVNSNNRTAFELYKAGGFQVEIAYNYYRQKVK